MEDSRRDLDSDGREELQIHLTMTIHSIFALKEALDFTNQPLPRLDSGLLEEKFSLLLDKSDTSPSSVHIPHPIRAPDMSTQHMQTPTFPSPEASVVCPRTWPCFSHPFLLCPIWPGPSFRELRCSPLPHWEFPLFPWRCWDPWSLLVFFSNHGRWLCPFPN